MSSIGKHRGTGMGPGRYTPPAMRQIGIGIHKAASELAETAARGDPQASMAALQQVTAACVACHNAYRVRWRHDLASATSCEVSRAEVSVSERRRLIITAWAAERQCDLAERGLSS